MSSASRRSPHRRACRRAHVCRRSRWRWCGARRREAGTSRSSLVPLISIELPLCFTASRVGPARQPDVVGVMPPVVKTFCPLTMQTRHQAVADHARSRPPLRLGVPIVKCMSPARRGRNFFLLRSKMCRTPAGGDAAERSRTRPRSELKVSAVRMARTRLSSGQPVLNFLSHHSVYHRRRPCRAGWPPISLALRGDGGSKSTAAVRLQLPLARGQFDEASHSHQVEDSVRKGPPPAGEGPLSWSNSG